MPVQRNDFLFCHPERSHSVREANGMAESKDPYFCKRGWSCCRVCTQSYCNSACHLCFERAGTADEIGGNRGPSTPQNGPLRGSFCYAQDDKQESHRLLGSQNPWTLFE